MTHVREKSRFGPCYALGELIGETATRYLYRNRAGTAFVSKSSSIHLAPCTGCARTIKSAKRWLKDATSSRGEQERPGASPARREPVSGMRRLQPTSHGTLDGQANASNTPAWKRSPHRRGRIEETV